MLKREGQGPRLETHFSKSQEIAEKKPYGQKDTGDGIALIPRTTFLKYKIAGSLTYQKSGLLK